LYKILYWLGHGEGFPSVVPNVTDRRNHLAQNFPNPFNPSTTFRYSIKQQGPVCLKIYNVAGQLVRTLVNETQLPRPEGFTFTWNGTNDSGGPVSSGIYFYQLTTTGFSRTRKLVLLK